MTRSPEEPSLGVTLRSVVCLVTIVALIEVHELLHLVVGRLVGLPARFLNLTAVGVGLDEAARANPAALAWMNGVAPMVSIALGVLAFAVLSAHRRRFRPWVRYALTWVAIQGVPYAGLQLMTAAAPVRLRGDGADFAAVIGGYFQAPPEIRAILTVTGLAVFLASGFWLGRLLSDSSVSPHRRLSLGARLATVAVWRRLLAAVIGTLSIGTLAMGIVLLFQGNANGLRFLLLSAFVGWVAVVALLVPWRWPGAATVWRHWLLPGLLASLVLTVVGLAFPSDFASAVFALTPLLATAWRQAFWRVQIPARRLEGDE